MCRGDSARVGIVIIACVVLTRCSLLLGNDLDGLVPYPPDAATDVRDATHPEGPDGTGALDVRQEEVVDHNPDATDIATEGAPFDDVVVADHLDGVSDQRDVDVADGSSNDARDEDAPFPPRDAGVDSISPPGDGGIVGVGIWVVSGAGAPAPGKVEVRGWMIPTTSLRCVTRSGITIEGWLQ